MGAVPQEKAGIGSAMNDITRLMATALGIAVIGSAMNSIYSNRVAAAVAALPAEAAAQQRLGGSCAPDTRHAPRRLRRGAVRSRSVHRRLRPGDTHRRGRLAPRSPAGGQGDARPAGTAARDQTKRSRGSGGTVHSAARTDSRTRGRLSVANLAGRRAPRPSGGSHMFGFNPPSITASRRIDRPESRRNLAKDGRVVHGARHLPGSPSAIFAIVPRSILPDLVLGSRSITTADLKAATGPI